MAELVDGEQVHPARVGKQAEALGGRDVKLGAEGGQPHVAVDGHVGRLQYQVEVVQLLADTAIVLRGQLVDHAGRPPRLPLVAGGKDDAGVVAVELLPVDLRGVQADALSGKRSSS